MLNVEFRMFVSKLPARWVNGLNGLLVMQPVAPASWRDVDTFWIRLLLQGHVQIWQCRNNVNRLETAVRKCFQSEFQISDFLLIYSHFWYPSDAYLQYFLIGEWNEWSHWSECSQTCGGGQRVRKRSLKYTPKEHPGFGFQSVISCDNSLSSRIQFDACNKNYCPGTQGPTNVTIHEPSSRAATPSMIS